MQGDNFQSVDSMFSSELGEDVRVKIIGIGGAGNNSVDRLQLDQQSKIRLAAINTDAQALAESPVPEKLMIGRTVTRGLSAGGEAHVGKDAAEADREAIGQMVQGMDLVFVLAGLGGGTGSGAAPIVAEIASKQGALVVAYVTLPFGMEGAGRKENADYAMNELREQCDAVIPLPNDLLMQHLPEEATVLDAFNQADSWINRGLSSICSMLFNTGLINLDFTTLRKAFVSRSGKTLFGLGKGEGSDYVVEALNDLEICPLLHTPEFATRADTLLVNIIGGTDLSIAQVNEVMAAVTEKFGSRENTILGAVIDDSLKQSLEICVVGTTDARAKRFVKKKRSPIQIAQSQSEAKLTEQQPAEEMFDIDELTVTTASATQMAQPVHDSKLKKKKKKRGEVSDSQEEFLFITEEAHRGYFDKTELNLYNDEDLDVPTFLRRGLKLHL